MSNDECKQMNAFFHEEKKTSHPQHILGRVRSYMSWSTFSANIDCSQCQMSLQVIYQYKAVNLWPENKSGRRITKHQNLG